MQVGKHPPPWAARASVPPRCSPAEQGRATRYQRHQPPQAHNGTPRATGAAVSLHTRGARRHPAMPPPAAFAPLPLAAACAVWQPRPPAVAPPLPRSRPLPPSSASHVAPRRCSLPSTRAVSVLRVLFQQRQGQLARHPARQRACRRTEQQHVPLDACDDTLASRTTSLAQVFEEFVLRGEVGPAACALMGCGRDDGLHHDPVAGSSGTGWLAGCWRLAVAAGGGPKR